MERLEEQSVQALALVTKTAIDNRIRAATGGDRILSGTRRGRPTPTGKARRGQTIGVGYKVRRGPTGTSALLSARGPLQLAENDVGRHYVVSRYARGAAYTRTTKAGRTVTGRSTRQSRIASVALGLGAAGGGPRAVLHFSNGDYRRWTTARSTGRHPWRRGLDEVRPKVHQILQTEERKALLSVFST